MLPEACAFQRKKNFTNRFCRPAAILYLYLGNSFTNHVFLKYYEKDSFCLLGLFICVEGIQLHCIYYWGRNSPFFKNKKMDPVRLIGLFILMLTSCKLKSFVTILFLILQEWIFNRNILVQFFWVKKHLFIIHQN